MTAKEFLSRAYRLDTRINNKNEQLQRLRSLASSTSMNYGGEQVTHSRKTDTLENNILRIIEAEQELNREIDELIEVKHDIKQVIELVADPTCRLLLESRYLCMNRWDDVCGKLEVSRSRVFELHQTALSMVETVLATRRSLCQ